MGYFMKRGVKLNLFKEGTAELIEDVVYVTDEWETIFVPRGFTCDMASIPRFAWRVCGGPRHNENARAGLVHDMLYKTKRFDRKKCDQIFEEILLNEGKTPIIAKLMYLAVRVFGGSHY